MRYSRETMIRALGTASLFSFALCACQKGDKVPSYMEVSQIEVITLPGEGSGSHRITELWVFVDDESKGVWRPPMRVPVIASGPHTVKMIAGIRRNGIADDRIQYPFYATWEAPVDLVLGAGVSVFPQFRYFQGPQFWIEDFDGVGFQFASHSQSDTTMVVVTDPLLVKEGIASGAIFIDGERPFYRGLTEQSFEVFSGPVFLELDHRNDHPFVIGVYYTIQGGAQIREAHMLVAPSVREDGNVVWNKLYVDLSAPLTRPGTSDKEIFFEANLASGYSSGMIYLDNVKLIRPGL